MTVLTAIQAASAVYIILIALTVVVQLLWYIFTGNRSRSSLSGMPALFGFISCVICAVTTIVVI